MTFKQLRIALLLLVLLLVIHNVFSDARRIADWHVPLFVTVYPHNEDGTQQAQRYIDALNQDDLQPIADWMAAEARRYGIELERPIYIALGEPISDPPPQQPVGGNLLERMIWVGKLRWWRFRFDDQGQDPDIIAVARYHDPNRTYTVPHSTGLERIRVASAHLFATRSQSGANRVVLTHELLHTVGATDKYDLGNLRPLFPHGYAEPDRSPVYPQRQAEIMAGRIPVSSTALVQAASLNQTRIGTLTAKELGWVE
jgi:plasmid stabilization system protein ParE